MYVCLYEACVCVEYTTHIHISSITRLTPITSRQLPVSQLKIKKKGGFPEMSLSPSKITGPKATVVIIDKAQSRHSSFP